VARDIESRLANWARWCQETYRPGMSITGLICERARRAVLGNVWSGHDVRDPLDEADARQVESAWCELPPIDKALVKVHYVDGERWQLGCRLAGIRLSQELHDMLLRKAVQRLEAALVECPNYKEAS
jgi:hypothetical protein